MISRYKYYFSRHLKFYFKMVCQFSRHKTHALCFSRRLTVFKTIIFSRHMHYFFRIHALFSRHLQFNFKTLLSLSRYLYFFNTLINFSRRTFKTPHSFSRDHRFNQDALWLFKRHRRLETASWKVVYLSWRTVLSDVFQDTFVTFKTSIFFQHTHPLFKTYIQDTWFIFKRSQMKSRRIIIFQDVKLSINTQSQNFKTQNILSRD